MYCQYCILGYSPEYNIGNNITQYKHNGNNISHYKTLFYNVNAIIKHGINICQNLLWLNCDNDISHYNIKKKLANNSLFHGYYSFWSKACARRIKSILFIEKSNALNKILVLLENKRPLQKLVSLILLVTK